MSNVDAQLVRQAALTAVRGRQRMVMVLSIAVALAASGAPAPAQAQIFTRGSLHFDEFASFRTLAP